MLGFTETGQMSVDGRHGGTLVAEVDLDLAKVLALLKEMSRITVAQTVNVGGLLDSAGLKGEAEGALQSGAIDRLGRGESALTAVTFGREKPLRVTMGLPLLAEPLQGALGQGNAAIRIALARANVQEPALGIHIRDLEVQTFAQAQAARVDGEQTNAVIQGGDLSKDLTDFLGGEDDRQLELRIGPDQLDFSGPGLTEGFFPEELDGADGLSGSLASEFLLCFQMEEVLPEFFRGDQVGRFAVKLAEFANASPVAQDGAFSQGQQAEVIEETI
jgi:hypothetical protein